MPQQSQHQPYSANSRSVAGSPSSYGMHKPAVPFVPVSQRVVQPTGGVIQRKVNATDFRGLMAEQEELQKNVLANPAPYAGKVVTVGLEHEFGSMVDAGLHGVSHLQIGESSNRMPFKNLPFFLETDADNAIEMVDPPFLVETTEPGKPIPHPADVDMIINMVEKRLYSLIHGFPTLNEFVQEMRGDPGLNFRIAAAQVKPMNLSHNTKEDIRTGHNTMSAPDLLRMRLAPSDKYAGTSISTQINFATSASVYNRMQEIHAVAPQAEYLVLGAEMANAITTDLTLDTPGGNIFMKQLNRVLSEQMAIPFMDKIRAMQQTEFGGGTKIRASAEKDTFITGAMLTSKVKDRNQLWIKDSLMSIGAGVLNEEEWARVKVLVTAAMGKARGLARDGLDATKAQYYALAKANMIAMLQEIVVQIDQRKITPASVYKPAASPGFLEHDPKMLGVRQDTYISPDKVQMPGLWDGTRMHVVEIRSQGVRKLAQIANNDADKNQTVADTRPGAPSATYNVLRHAYFKKAEPAPVAAGTGMVSLPAAGTGMVTLPVPGTAPMHGTGAASLPAASKSTLPIPGTAPMYGTGAASLPAASKGMVTLPVPGTAPMYGTGTASLPAASKGTVTLPVPGTAPMYGTGAASLPAASKSTSPLPGTAPMYGTGAASLPAAGTGMVTLPVPGTTPMHSTGAASLPAASKSTLPVPGTAPIPGTGAASLPGASTGMVTLPGTAALPGTGSAAAPVPAAGTPAVFYDPLTKETRSIFGYADPTKGMHYSKVIDMFYDPGMSLYYDQRKNAYFDQTVGLYFSPRENFYYSLNNATLSFNPVTKQYDRPPGDTIPANVKLSFNAETKRYESPTGDVIYDKAKRAWYNNTDRTYKDTDIKHFVNPSKDLKYDQTSKAPDANLLLKDIYPSYSGVMALPQSDAAQILKTLEDVQIPYNTPPADMISTAIGLRFGRTVTLLQVYHNLAALTAAPATEANRILRTIRDVRIPHNTPLADMVNTAVRTMFGANVTLRQIYFGIEGIIAAPATPGAGFLKESADVPVSTDTAIRSMVMTAFMGRR